MTRFGKRTWRFLAAIWLGAAALELVVLELARRTHSTWVLLLGAALLVVPLAATDMTIGWLSRARRKRWKRHDLEDELARAAKAAPADLTPRHPPPGRAGR